MKRALAWLKFAWHYEPVLIGALPTVLATVGFTTAEAKSTTDAVSGALAALAQVALALAARQKVRPNKTEQS